MQPDRYLTVPKRIFKYLIVVIKEYSNTKNHYSFEPYQFHSSNAYTRTRVQTHTVVQTHTDKTHTQTHAHTVTQTQTHLKYKDTH